jgi:DNA-binding MarR family transcriptional regulator
LGRSPPHAPTVLVLADFVPFRLNRLADAVSRNLSEIYRQRFGLEVPEWRVLVTVGQRQVCTAQHVASSTRMHKTRVSRAVATLQERQLLARVSNVTDARERRLELTGPGRKLYAALVPLALQREREILGCLANEEREAFMHGVARLEKFLGLSSDE